MVELVAVVLEGGQKVFAECQCMIKVRKDDDFLVFFGHDSLDYLLEDDEFSGIEDCMLAGFVFVGVIQEIRVNGTLTCQFGAFKDC